MLEGFLKGLEQPEYIHVLINPLPVYGLAMGLIGLIIGLVLRSREARTGAFAVILIAAASAWPTLHYGQHGYDRVKGMADSEGQKWLDEHKHRGEQLMYVFYALGALALVSIAVEWKRPKAALAGGNYDTNAGHGHARRWRLHCLHGRTHPAQRVPLRASARTPHRGATRALTKSSECFGETLPGESPSRRAILKMRSSDVVIRR